MKQKTNKNRNKNLRPVPEAEMRQNVLKSGLCNEVIAGVLTDSGEIPNIPNANGNMQMPAVGNMQESEQRGVPTDEELAIYIQNCKENCIPGETTIESLACKIYDLIMQNNALVDLIGKIQSGEAVYIGGEMQEGDESQMQDPQMQGDMQMQGGQMQGQPMQYGMQNPQIQYGGGMQMQYGMQNPQMQYGMQMQNPQVQYGGRSVPMQNIPRSTGGTGGHAQKQAYIPKSQVEKMTREEIREMFDVIDRSRKEW